MKIIDFQYLLCANFYSNYSSKSPKGRDSIHTQISGSCNQMLSQINQGKSRACITPSILRKWSKSNSSLSSSENRKTYVQYVQRSRNSLVCFSHPKIKGFIASLYSRLLNKMVIGSPLHGAPCSSNATSQCLSWELRSAERFQPSVLQSPSSESDASLFFTVNWARNLFLVEF